MFSCCFSFFSDLTLLEEMFSFACPKFVTPSPPNYDAVPGKYHRVFIRGFSIICFSWHSNYNRVNAFSFMVVYQFSKLVFLCYFIGLSKKRGNFSKVLFYYLIFYTYSFVKETISFIYVVVSFLIENWYITKHLLTEISGNGVFFFCHRPTLF